MKNIAPCLSGSAFLMLAIYSLPIHAAEFECRAEDYNCLYSSVNLANQTSEADTIYFFEGDHFPTGAPGSRCAPPVTGDITIMGYGRDVTRVIAQGSCAFFHVKPGGSLTLRDIVLADGNLDGTVAGPTGVQRGAAVYNEGALRIEWSTLSGHGVNDNFASLSGGGAIYSAQGSETYINEVEFFYNSVERENYGGAVILNEGTMTIRRSRFYENNGFGGIIANGIPGSSTTATLTLSDSIIIDNYGSTGIRNGALNAVLLIERTFIYGGMAVEGGGIYNGGILEVRESTISSNTATRGGGMYSAAGSTSTLINSTISYNRADGVNENEGIGGGVFNFGGTVYIASSTVALNSSQQLGAAIAATSDVDGSAQVYIKGSLIAGHSNSVLDQSCYDFGPNDARKLFLVENNLITEESNCYAPSKTDVVVPEAITLTEVITPLGNYGGPTPTHALLPNSPAIDTEDKVCTDFNGVPILIDQHGKPRTGCDIGSVDATTETPLPDIQLKLLGNKTGIQPNSNGYISLAILSSPDSIPFNPVQDVNRNSIRLGAAGAVPLKFATQDVNKDGIADLVMTFRIRQIGITCGDMTLELWGSLIGHGDFIASTSITTRGCKRP